MKPPAPDLGDTFAQAHLTIRLDLVVQGDQQHWQGRVEGGADARRCFESLPELIAWLARLQWWTSAGPGVR